MSRSRQTTLLSLSLAVLAVCLLSGKAVRSDAVRTTKGTIRRPCGLVLDEEGTTLFVAGARSGTVAVIDTESLQITGEFPVAARLSDLKPHPDGRRLLATDADSNRLLVLTTEGERIEVTGHVALPHDPVRICVDAPEHRCAIAGRWSRTVSLVEFAGGGAPA